MNPKSLFHRQEHFTVPTASLSPAEKAKQKWDEREGEIIEQNYMLRKLLIGLMGAIIVLAGALCYKVISENYLVYVVETDIKTGEVRNVGTVASMENYQPTDQVYTYFIRQFVQDIRNVPLDEVVYKNQLKNAYSFLTKDGAAVLTNRLQDEKRMEKLGRSTVQITINSILPLEGGKSYQVRWTEVEYPVGKGDARTVTSYTGVITTEHIKSNDKDQIAANPLGIYITDLRWEQDVEGKESKKGGNVVTNTAQNATNAASTTAKNLVK